MSQRIILAGGGTAGHVEPALAVADALRRRDSSLSLEFIGTSQGLESLLVPQRGFVLRSISKVALPRTISFNLIRFPFSLLRSILGARKIVKGSICVVGFGGYVSASAYLGAKLAGVPIAIHEANAKPGWANRLGRHFARLIAVNFEEVQKQWPGAIVTGMPIRGAIAELSKIKAEELAKFRDLNARSLGLDPARPIVAMFGGSQGSIHMNEAMASYLVDPEPEIQIIHALGINNKLPEKTKNYLPMPYFHDMAAIYGMADLLITRSGAVTCSELVTARKYAVLVPLPHGNGEQLDNAQALVAQAAATLVPNEEFTGDWLRANLSRVLSKARASAPVSYTH